jgi:hypothetical protein
MVEHFSGDGKSARLGHPASPAAVALAPPLTEAQFFT